MATTFNIISCDIISGAWQACDFYNTGRPKSVCRRIVCHYFNSCCLQALLIVGFENTFIWDPTVCMGIGEGQAVPDLHQALSYLHDCKSMQDLCQIKSCNCLAWDAADGSDYALARSNTQSKLVSSVSSAGRLLTLINPSDPPQTVHTAPALTTLNALRTQRRL